MLDLMVVVPVVWFHDLLWLFFCGLGRRGETGEEGEVVVRGGCSIDEGDEKGSSRGMAGRKKDWVGFERLEESSFGCAQKASSFLF